MNNELRYYDALKKIGRAYKTLAQLKASAVEEYGVSYTEALEMAYENLQIEARDAIYGKHRPKTAEEQSK